MNANQTLNARGQKTRSLLRSIPLRGASWANVMEAIGGLLDAAGVPDDERAELLGGAFVMEAVRKHWTNSAEAPAAHERLRRDDPELADAVEALSPMLLGRAQTRVDAARAVEAIEAMFDRRNGDAT